MSPWAQLVVLDASIGLPQGFRSFVVNDSTASGRDTWHVGGGVALRYRVSGARVCTVVSSSKFLVI